jgi:hypothetical protein
LQGRGAGVRRRVTKPSPFSGASLRKRRRVEASAPVARDGVLPGDIKCRNPGSIRSDSR